MKKIQLAALLLVNFFVQVYGATENVKIESKELKPGIIKHEIYAVNNKGPVRAHALEINLNHENISIKVGLPNKKTLTTKEKLSEIVKSEMAYAGINANYFDVNVGNPVGTLITHGEWITGSVYNRAAVGFSSEKKVFIDQVMIIGKAKVSRNPENKSFFSFEIDGLNTPPHLFEKAGIFTRTWNTKLTLPEDILAVIVNNGCIKKIRKGTVDIPKNGYVLISNNDHILNSLREKDCIEINWNSQPDWSHITEAISGGPYLIMDGQVYIDDKIQHFKFPKKDYCAARSAIGVGKNGNLYLIAVDGKRGSYGLTLNELSELFKKLSLQDAINLDGGGSSTLIAGGEIINNLSEHHERKISNGLLVFYKE